MSLLNTDSHDHYSDITLKYSSDSTAVVTAGAGRKGTAGVATNGTTFFTLDRVAVNQPIAALTLIRGIAMRLTTLPVATQTILQFQEADGTDQICIGVLANGTVRAFRGNTAGSALASSAFPIAPDIYYYVECKVFIDNAAGTVEVRLWPALDRSLGSCTITIAEDTVTSLTAQFTDADLGRLITFGAFTSHVIAINSSTEAQVADTAGATVTGTGTLSYIPALSFTGDTQNAGTGTLAKIKHGLGLSASWDDAYLCDTEGSAFNGFLGNKHIEAHFPNDAGFYTTWVPVPALPNYGNVDENPPDEDTSYNYAPNVDPVVSPSFRSVESVTDSATCPVPADAEIGDLLFAVIRNTAASIGDPLPNVDMSEFIGVPPPNAGFALNFAVELGAPSLTTWSSQIAYRIVDGTEPASYTFEDIHLDAPAIGTRELAILCFTGVNQAIPVEDTTGTASPIRQASVSFLQVDTLTDNDLIVAFTMTETEAPSPSSGYTSNYAGSLIGVASKVEASAGGYIPPSTTLGSIDTWGTRSFALKANATIETGSKDTFPTQDTVAATVSGVMVNLCARVDEAGHTVGATMRQSATDSDSDGVMPTTDYLIYQFPYETAPDSGAWSAAKFNESESGYALDATEPPIPPEEAVIFWAEADQLDADYNDGDQITSWTEGGIHAYILVPARAIAGDFIMQTFETSVAAVNNQNSVQGFTESYTCTPATRSAGFKYATTDSDLFLPDAFTLIAVLNFTQLSGCVSFGNPIVITRRGTDAGLDFTGWALYISGADPPSDTGQGTAVFYRFGSSFSILSQVQGTTNGLNPSTTYLVTVICDGTTMRLRVDGVEQDSTAYVTGVEPLSGNDFWYLNNGDQDPDVSYAPQGQVPYVKIWSVELDGATLAAEEAALAVKYQ